jgi:hypothetical protein
MMEPKDWKFERLDFIFLLYPFMDDLCTGSHSTSAMSLL